MTLALSAILWGIPTFSLLIVLHEGGHFAVARAFGVKVHEFMLGLPGPALRFHGKATTYGVTAVPLGGYVRIAGMEPGPEDPLMEGALAYVMRLGRATAEGLASELDIDVHRAELLLSTLADWDAIGAAENDSAIYVSKAGTEPAESAGALLDAVRSHTYRGLSTPKRVALLSAGVLVNLIAAVLVFVVILTAVGAPTQTLTLASVLEGGPAAEAGIVSGDTLVGLGGNKLPDWQALLESLVTHKPGDTLVVTYLHDGVEKTATVVLSANESGGARLGVGTTTVNVRSSLPQALKDSFTWIGLVFKAIGGFFNPSTFKTSVAGSSSVIGASVAVAEAAQAGPLYYAFIVALLSLSLGVVNVLPIPPLDGGKIAIEIIERIVGRPLPRNVSLGISAAGALMLFWLIGYLMYSDVARFVVKGG